MTQRRVMMQPATLATKVSKAPAAVLEILRTVRIADSLEKAIAVREQLNAY